MKIEENIIKNNIRKIKRILASWGFYLDEYQPHTTGERKLMSQNKLVLIGRDSTGRKVVIKTSDKTKEQERIRQEHQIGRELGKIASATKGVLLPKKVLFKTGGGFTFLITEFIEQPKVFVAHGLNEQFKMITKAIEGIETVDLQKFHEILGDKPRACDITTSANYCKELERYIKFINTDRHDTKLASTLELTGQIFLKNTDAVTKFSGYLVHEDFCPHNFRVLDRKLYILDHAAVNFGNKHLTWARLLNYMALHNPPLERSLVRYLKEKKTAEDIKCLRLFRMYKTVFLITHYVKVSKNVSGKLLKLTNARIDFWHNFLDKLIEKKSLPKADLVKYLKVRNSLRSNEEKKRQKEFAVA